MLERINEAPDSGLLYALYTDRVVFEQYTSVPAIETEKLLELHLFDSVKEYRFIKSRLSGGMECVVSDEIKRNTEGIVDVYTEDIYVEMGNHEKIKVVNYLSFDENGMLSIDDYRLEEV